MMRFFRLGKYSEYQKSSEERIIFGSSKSQNWRIYHSKAPGNYFFHFYFRYGWKKSKKKIMLPITNRRLKFCSQKYNLTVNQISNGEATEKLRFGDHPNENFDQTRQLLMETMEFHLFACVQS